MTKLELIEALKAYPDDTEIAVLAAENGCVYQVDRLELVKHTQIQSHSESGVRNRVPCMNVCILLTKYDCNYY